MGETRKVAAKRNIYAGFLQHVVGLIMPFLTRTVVIHYMGSLYLGLNSLFTSVLQVLSLAELGMGEAIVFSMYKPLASGDTKKVCALLKYYKQIYRIIGMIILAVGIILMPFLKFIIKGEVPEDVNIYILYIVFLANTVLSYFLYAYKNSLLTACQRADIISLVGMFTNLAMNLLQIVIIVFFHDYLLYCMMLPVFTVINNVIFNRISVRLFPEYICKGKIESQDKADIKRQVIALAIGKICGVCRNSFDSIVLSAFMGLQILACYQNYYYILNTIMGFILVIISGVIATVGNSVAVETVEKNYRDFVKFQFLYMWLACWCTTCLYCLYQPFMELWAGSELMFSNDVMSIFCIYFFMYSLGNVCYIYKSAAGLWKYNKIYPLIEAAANLVLNIILVQHFGVIGVLLSTIICLVFTNVYWNARIVYKYYFKKSEVEFIKRTLIYMGITVCMCLITGKACSMIHILGIGGLIMKALICVIVPAFLFLLVGRLFSEYKEAMQSLRIFITKRK